MTYPCPVCGAISRPGHNPSCPRWWDEQPRRSRAFRVPRTVRWAIWERDDFRCVECGSRRFLTIDHIVPRSRGGTDAAENLQTLCEPCNRRKGDALAVA